MLTDNPIQPEQVLTGSLFNEPMRVVTVRTSGADSVEVGLVGQQTERFRQVTLTSLDIADLQISGDEFSYDGDGQLVRLGLQAYSLGIAHEFDPYFGLSISRVDPLPHQLEAVYEYFLKLPSVRFLLAGRRWGGKDHNGRPANPRTQNAWAGGTHPYRVSREPVLSVAARDEGEVRPAVHRFPGQRHSQPVRLQSMA